MRVLGKFLVVAFVAGLYAASAPSLAAQMAGHFSDGSRFATPSRTFSGFRGDHIARTGAFPVAVNDFRTLPGPRRLCCDIFPAIDTQNQFNQFPNFVAFPVYIPWYVPAFITVQPVVYGYGVESAGYSEARATSDDLSAAGVADDQSLEVVTTRRSHDRYSARREPQRLARPAAESEETVVAEEPSAAEARDEKPRRESSSRANPLGEPSAGEKEIPSPKAQVAETPATLLVFRDGHRIRVHNYAIQGKTLFQFEPPRTLRIALSELDVPATSKVNEEQGIDFHLP